MRFTLSKKVKFCVATFLQVSGRVRESTDRVIMIIKCKILCKNYVKIFLIDESFEKFYKTLLMFVSHKNKTQVNEIMM